MVPSLSPCFRTTTTCLVECRAVAGVAVLNTCWRYSDTNFEFSPVLNLIVCYLHIYKCNMHLIYYIYYILYIRIYKYIYIFIIYKYIYLYFKGNDVSCELYRT